MLLNGLICTSYCFYYDTKLYSIVPKFRSIKYLPGPYGAAAAVLLNIVSSLIGLFMTTPDSTPTLEQVMRDVLDEFRDETLYMRASAYASSLQKVHGALVATRAESKRMEGKDLTSDQMGNLNDQIKLFQTDTLLENMKHGIADEIESGKVSDAERALKTLNLYCKLNIVKELVLVEFISYIKEEGPKDSKMPTFYHKFMSTTRENDKKYLEFFHLPEVKQAVIAVMYQHSPEKYPELREYMKAIKVTPIPDMKLKEGRTIYLTPKKWTNWHFYLSSFRHSLIYGSRKTNDQNKFILRKPYTRNKANVWRLENKYYPGYFLSARKFDSCLPLYNSDEVDYVEGLTMDYVRSIERNCRSLCLANDKCSGCHHNCYSTFKIGRLRNLVSINYEWRITRLKTPAGCYYHFISATQENFGPGYTLFMKDSKNANAYLKYGNPKEQGMFKFSKTFCRY